MQGAVATPLQAAARQLAPRIIFKPRLIGGETGIDDSFMDGLAAEHRGLRRRLLDASGGQQMLIQSLGQHTGMNMIEVPQGVNVSEVLRALQGHPGAGAVVLISRCDYLVQCRPEPSHTFAVLVQHWFVSQYWMHACCHA